MRPAALLVLILSLSLLLVGCQSISPTAPSAAPATAETPSAPRRQGRQPPVEPRTFVDGVIMPVGLTFAPDGRMFFAEVKKGTIRVVNNGVLAEQPFATITTANGPEQGVVGLTIDPNFNQNHYVYVYYTVPKRSGKADCNRVMRFTDHNGLGQDPQIIIDNIPPDVKGAHNGGRMLFGPDGKLYVATGAPGDDKNDAQKLDVLEGKILRLNPDGTVPADNPFPGSPVYALGLRNPFGLATHPRTGRLYAVDNGPRGYDELDLIQAGGDYGSPSVVGEAHDSRFVDPLWNSGEERLGVSGLAFYTGSKLPEYHGDLFYCLWNPGLLHRVRLSGPEFDQVQEEEDIAVDCRLDVADGPDGALYVASVTKILRLDR